MTGLDASSGWRLRVFDTLGSTSDHCVALARTGESGGLAVLARQQTAPRGSRGRTWQSPAGNLCLSLLIRDAGPASAMGGWALLASVALAEALVPFLPDEAALTLKWPNDVLLNGGKLAGVLLDSALTPGGETEWLVIGIGANLATPPVVPGRRTAALTETGISPPAPEAVAHALLPQIDHWRGCWLRDGLGTIRAAWLARAHPLGTWLSLQSGPAANEGRFAGLSDDGSLILETATGLRRFATGETLLRAAV